MTRRAPAHAIPEMGEICMDLSVRGDDATVARFRRYMASNPAARRGWVGNLDAPDAVTVDEDYIDAFREIAANFGLEVAQIDSTESLG